MRRKLMTVDDAKETKKQHKKPCSDCPFLRDSIRGWLGGSTPQDFLMPAHFDVVMACHTRTKPNDDDRWQCAGSAIYRANVFKQARGEMLDLPRDNTLCFSTPMEFIAHHTIAKKDQEDDDA